MMFLVEKLGVRGLEMDEFVGLEAENRLVFLEVGLKGVEDERGELREQIVFGLDGKDRVDLGLGGLETVGVVLECGEQEGPVLGAGKEVFEVGRNFEAGNGFGMEFVLDETFLESLDINYGKLVDSD